MGWTLEEKVIFNLNIRLYGTVRKELHIKLIKHLNMKLSTTYKNRSDIIETISQTSLIHNSSQTE